LGVSGSVSNGTLKNNDGLAQTDIQTTVLSLYGSYEFGGGFFLDADLGYGHSRDNTDIDWFTGGGSKSADYSSDSFMGGLNFGYGFHLTDAATLTPSAGLRFIHLKQDGYEEKAFEPTPDDHVVANWFGDRKQDFVEVPLNLKLATTFETSGGGTISPEVRVGGIIAATNSESEQRVGFVGSSDSFLISGIGPGKSRLTAGAGIKAQLNDSLDIFANYDLESRSGYKAHSASFGVGISF
jgi:outer membrane autotransporter protein